VFAQAGKREVRRESQTDVGPIQTRRLPSFCSGAIYLIGSPLDLLATVANCTRVVKFNQGLLQKILSHQIFSYFHGKENKFCTKQKKWINASAEFIIFSHSHSKETPFSP
jgi:hypothetical protein